MIYKLSFSQTLLGIFIASVSLFTACNGNGDRSNTNNTDAIVKFQQQLEALQQQGSINQQTLTQIDELQKVILELQQNNNGSVQSSQDPQTMAKIAELQRKN